MKLTVLFFALSFSAVAAARCIPRVTQLPICNEKSKSYDNAACLAAISEDVEKHAQRISNSVNRYSPEARAARAELDKLPEIRIGMSAKQVYERSKWGPPESINATLTAHGSSEQWVYPSQSYLYFTNCKLTAIQN